MNSFRKRNSVRHSDERGRDGSAATRVQIELQNTRSTGPRMTQNSPRNDIQMVLPLPPSYEEVLQTSAPDGSNSTVAFGFSDSRNRDVLVRTISLPPSYEEAIQNRSTPANFLTAVMV